MQTRPTKEQFLERLQYEIEDMLRIKYNDSFRAKDTEEDYEYTKDVRGTNVYNTLYPWVRQEGVILGMCFWFGYELVEIGKFHIQVKRGKKIIIDLDFEEMYKE